MPAINWRGVYPAVTTQFRPDFSVDIPATLQHIDALLAAGVHGLIMLGSVGENTTLEFGEKREVLQATVAHVKGRVPVLTGVAETTRLKAGSSATSTSSRALVRPSYGRRVHSMTLSCAGSPDATPSG